MKELADAGIQVGIGIAPTIPGLTTDIPRLLQRAKCSGATKAFINMLRLPGSVAPYFEQRLREKLPTKADRILNRIREARGGKLNSSKFGERMRGKGQYWAAQEKLFNVYAKRLGFNEHRVGGDYHSRSPYLSSSYRAGIVVRLKVALSSRVRTGLSDFTHCIHRTKAMGNESALATL